MLETDVLVVGGGLAGVAAAISSAASGSQTLLLERSDELGGNTTLANVHTFCGLFETPQKDSDHIYANPGFSDWFALGLMHAGGAQTPEVHGRVAVMSIYPPRLASYTRQLCQTFPSLDVRYQSKLISLGVDSSGLEPATAVFLQAEKEITVKAKTVIDATGDASAGALAGADCESAGSDELQNATLIFRVSGANSEDLAGYSRLRISAAIARGAQQGKLLPQCESIFIRPGESDGEAYISLNVPKWQDRDFDPLDESFLNEYTRYACDLGETLMAFLRQNVSGWSECRLLAWPSVIGIRESRHMLGKYVMTEQDILSGEKFDDVIARSTWPIELWHDHYHATFQYPEAASEIPLAALVSRTHRSIGMAGRCMSGTHEALGALRVLGTAMATGEAIGIAAAIANEQNCTLDEVTAEAVRIRREELINSKFIQS